MGRKLGFDVEFRNIFSPKMEISLFTVTAGEYRHRGVPVAKYRLKGCIYAVLEFPKDGAPSGFYPRKGTHTRPGVASWALLSQLHMYSSMTVHR